jgi:hypothetical protein
MSNHIAKYILVKRYHLLIVKPCNLKRETMKWSLIANSDYLIKDLLISARQIALQAPVVKFLPYTISKVGAIMT